MRGKEKCRILRQIRQEIAEKNDIEFVTSECKYQGECRGTCPKCEAELKYLEAEMEKRRVRNRRIALAGISVGTILALSGCASVDRIRAAVVKPTGEPEIEELTGEVAPEPELDGYIAEAETDDASGLIAEEKAAPEAEADV